MELVLAEAIVRESYDLEVYEGYSGRGMYGAETSGVTGSFSNIMSAVAKMASGLDSEYEHDQEVLEALDKCSWRTDSMGYDMIVY